MPAGQTLTLPGALLTAGRDDNVALWTPGKRLTFADLRARVDRRASELDLGERAMVVLEATATVEFVVTYLALLEAGHVPLLAGAHLDRLAAAWRPRAVITTSASGVTVDRRPTEARELHLHPELRLLLSTSGSTGAPKLVRLSDRNLVSNARAIAEYLELGPDDRGITSLPLHYCYGLSVLHSHLAVGAGIVVTEASVVDPCFADALEDAAVTNVAGVPHTFELLDRAGPERVRVPSLRFLTVAGGRMRPDRVRAWPERCRAWGVELFVMYGQTEATARMAYLPPALADRHPGAIGVPIPGGSLEVRPVAGQPDGVGELVYRGDNVMMGYAVADEDLAAGHVLAELRTGDLGRYHADDGVFEIVGRSSRFVKPFGLRIDLDVVERELATSVAEVAVAGDDDGVAVHAPGADADAVAQAVTELTGLPPSFVAVCVDAGGLPRTETGKIDYDAVRASARRGRAPVATGTEHAAASGRVAAIYAAVLGRGDVGPSDTFVSLGGDSMNYIECSIRLEQALGHVPADWHVTPVADLEPRTVPRRRWWVHLDTTTLLRAVGIAAIVAPHMRLRHVPGGAHILLAVVGYNLSRFLLPIEPTAERVRAGLRTIARTAVPTMAWVAARMTLFGAYSAGTLALINNYVGPRGHRGGHWHFWFIEVFVHLCLLTTLLLAVPQVRRVERRWPYLFPLALLGLTLVLRMEWAWMGDWYNLRFRTHGVAWYFVLGWLAHRSTTLPKRLLTTGLSVVTVLGFFHHPARDWFILVALVVLIWRPQVPWPAWALRPVATLASASMWILITHFTVWPVLLDHLPMALAYPLTLAVGVLACAAVAHGGRALRRLAQRDRRPLASWRPAPSAG